MADPETLKIDFTDADGAPRQWKVLGEREVPATPGSGMSLVEIEAESESGTTLLVQKAITREADAADAGLYRRLENEVRIGLLLHRRFGGPAYPVELARLVGYDVDCAEPFVLFERYRGAFAAEVAGRLLLNEQRRFQSSLLRGVRVLEQAGVVHRGITPHSVRWDGHGAQLADFELAGPASRPRRPEGARPWASPQQRMGVGGTCARDDVWSAGMVIYHVATGPVPPAALDREPDLGQVEPRTREVLAGVFAQKAVHRPHPEELLRRLRVPDPIPPAEEAADRRFDEGGRRFDEMMRQKHGKAYRRPPEPADRVVVDEDEPEPARTTAEPTGPMPQPPPPVAWTRPGGGAGMVVAVVVVVVIVALALFVLGGFVG
ncbi:serine/threonine-protein kinase [Sphaerisporangium aureirubrum]|uniref:non-specific serine/threonine protein kinase n=1 Tax=Sphaerisporangium aureirubrum TaxID=1544736 RepID=A0ABW1NQW0_9ACTN